MGHNGAAITGCGAAFPGRRITNHDLEKMIDTSNKWILDRTGIRERRILEEGLSTVDLSERAARDALEGAGIKPHQLELILVATVTPDYPLPAAACSLQARLGAFRAAAMDLAAGCSGFIYALTVADQFIRTGAYRNALVVGVEILSRIVDWTDRSTCVLFGDGAGAVVIQPVRDKRGLVAFELGADGRGLEYLYIPAGGTARPASAETVRQQLHYVKMNGPEIFKFAVRIVQETLDRLLEKGKLSYADLDYLFLHQANLRIIESIRMKLQLPREKVPVNIDRYGNMSSAAIPVALTEEAASGRLKEGDLLAAVAFGAGLTWGGILMRW